MTGRIWERLRELGIELPNHPLPVANYVPFTRSGNLIFVSGQLPLTAENPSQHFGVVGVDLDIADAKTSARIAAINVVAVLSAALNGDLDKVARIVKVTGYVNAAPGFRDHPEIINGASDLFVEIFGERGRHARAAVGAGSLPRNAVVEIEAIVEIA